MKRFLLLVLLFLCISPGLGFAPFPPKPRDMLPLIETSSSPNLLEQPSLMASVDKVKGLSNSVAGFASGALSLAPFAWAGEEIEMADLPPPWIPALFGIGLLVGVGVLTGSLSSVIDEEASLGMQSGARAKKEIERSRSSYFKKK